MTARPLRIVFAGALFHVTARGNAQKNIFKWTQNTDSSPSRRVLRCELLHCESRGKTGRKRARKCQM